MPERWQNARTPTPIMTASTMRLEDSVMPIRQVFQYESWQDEAWDYWRNLGELTNGISWKAAALSRVRLLAAEMVPGGDEPAPLTEGPAADLMAAFAGGMAGQPALMKMFGYQIGVPGAGWLVVERPSDEVPLELATWRFMPVTSVRNRNGFTTEIRVGQNVWRPIAGDAFATKVFNPDPQFPWKEWSSVQAALPILRRIDLIDRRIVAVLVSRLAMNGLLLVPSEGQWKVPERLKDAPNPLLASFLESAAQNIKMPGSASAALPMLIEYTGELIEKWRLLTWPDVMPAELVSERQDETKRLGKTINVPDAAMSGLQDMNHWNGFLENENAAKFYIAPDAEIACGGWTDGFLHPLMKQMGESLIGPNGGKIICWYDLSEVTAPPDKTKQVTDAYDRMEASGEALRREYGLDEADKPENEELADMILKKLVTMAPTASAAFEKLTGITLPQAPASGIEGNRPADDAGQPASGAQQRDMPQDQPNQRDVALAAAISAGRVGKPSPRPRGRAYNGLG